VLAASAEPHRGGAGEPLVLLHGIGSSWSAWRPVLPALEVRHDVLALNLPGFGGAPPLAPGVAPNVEALTDAVEREVDAAGFERPFVAGNSLGGWISLELARRRRARGVVALSPAGMWTPRELTYSRAVLRLMYAVTRRIRPHAGALTRPTAGRMAIFSLVSARPWRIDPEEARHVVEALADADAFPATLEHTITGRAERLDEVRTPAVVAWGTRDLLLPPRQAARCARAIPGAELRMLAGCGHVPMWDDPELVARAILGLTSSRRWRGSAQA
jgi:pimeloyl-ACP methyl ester carboxylesterase